MIKLKAKTKDCQLIIRAKLSSKDTLDIREFDIFARKYVRGFLKPKMVKNSLIEYTGPVGISLHERLKKSISKYDFFFIMEQIVDVVQKIEANHLAVNKLVLDLNNVYINETTKEMQFIYLPLATVPSNKDVIAFIESIIYSVKPMQDNDCDYVSKFVYFIKSLSRFDVDKIEKYIARVDRNVVNTIKKHNVGQSGFMTNKQRDYYDHYDKKQNEDDTDLLEEDDDATGLLDEDATGLLQDEDATGLLNEDEEATGLLSYDEEETGLLDESSGFQAHYPSLYRVLTGDTYSVNKPVYRIGKERSYVDLFVANNNAISRSHADIVCRNGRYFVVDQNSRNRTYINNLVVQPQLETEIFDGDTLKLANEEFVFHV